MKHCFIINYCNLQMDDETSYCNNFKNTRRKYTTYQTVTTRKRKQLSTTIQESQVLSFTHANTIGQSLMGDSNVFNCM